MSGNLLEVKKKISGVKNTRKITKAMQLVAASKMRQFQRRALHARAYVWDLFQVLNNNLDAQSTSVYTQQRREGKVLFVLYTSDKGLCGALNTKLNQSLLRSERWKELEEDERLLVTIGKKSKDFAKNNGLPIAKSYEGIPEKLSNLDALAAVDGILDFWRSGEVKEVVIIAPHYKNSFTFYPVMKTFLPFSQKSIDSVLGALDEDDRPKFEERRNKFMLFEPSEELVLERLYEQLIQAMFIQSFLELKASEYSSRMIAMQNATDSADRIVGELTLVYNKARQAAITQEIAELIGAKMALEDDQ